MINVSAGERCRTVPRHGCLTQLLAAVAGSRQAPHRAFGNQQLSLLAPGRWRCSWRAARHRAARHSHAHRTPCVVPTPEGTGLPSTAGAQAQPWWDGRRARPMPGEAGTARVLVWVRGCSWRASPAAMAGAGRALGTGVGAVPPGPAASTGLPGLAGLPHIVPAAASEPSPEHGLPGRRREEVGW